MIKLSHGNGVAVAPLKTTVYRSTDRGETSLFSNGNEPSDRQLMGVFGVIALIFSILALISWGMALSDQVIRSASRPYGLSFILTVIAVALWVCCGALLIRIRRERKIRD